jgi:hypothetical protein
LGIENWEKIFSFNFYKLVRESIQKKKEKRKENKKNFLIAIWMRKFDLESFLRHSSVVSTLFC